MDIWQLKYFIQICNDRSFSEASRALHISQQGLSRVIQNLEKEFEKPLFYRSKKGVEPTEFGYLLLEKSRKIVEDFDLMIDYLYERAKNKKGKIIMGLPNILYTDYFADIIFRFTEKYSEIELKVVSLGSYDCERHMKDDLLDIALTIKPVNNDIFAYIPVTSINFWVVVNKKNPLANLNEIRFEELKNQKFILLSNEYKSSDTIINCCINKGFEPNIIFTSAQQELIIEMVALNRGITILPENSSHKASKSNENVTSISLIDSPLKTEMGFIVKKSRKQDSILNVLIEFIVKYFDCINL